MKNIFSLDEINTTTINLDEVRNFAFQKHDGQTRPNKAKELKTVHLAEVASLVKKANGNIFAISAAYLHDTLEDTDTTMQEIIDNFGIEVGLLVKELTDPDEFYSMPLSLRKEKQAERIKNYHEDTKLVKIADQISNCSSVLNDPPTDWDSAKCLEYIIGAKKIVDACSGCNLYLENNFMEVYILGLDKYKS